MVEVSVLVLTYNHADYIKKCLDGIMMQKTEIPYEVLILDDASNDGTSSIVKEYVNKYSNVRALIKKKNSMHPTKNVYTLMKEAKGRYIAWCEGDDYWIDELKIQKQYDFMESHMDFSACFSNSIIVNQNEEIVEQCPVVPCHKEDGIYTIEDFSRLSNPGMSAAYFLRNYFQEEDWSILYKADKYMGDVTSFAIAICHGKFFQMREYMSAYRYVEKNGSNNYNSIQLGNRYKEYNMVRYWCVLENYIRIHFDAQFRFFNLPIAFYNISNNMPLKAMNKIADSSIDKSLYKRLLCLNKMFSVSSCEMIDKNVELLKGKHGKWHSFKRERKKIVIWGAGHLAAEYLDRYAWKRNILFLTDNNSTLYGKSFKGYLIMEPDELLEHKDDVIVLIANDRHEQDIAKQLEDMGIETYYGIYSMARNRWLCKVTHNIVTSIQKS